jgi:A/G-specific adenine glycosylase
MVSMGRGGPSEKEEVIRVQGEPSQERPQQDLDLDPSWVGFIREQLANWYQDTGRDLPWRQQTDPYRVLVAELMLVQTTVKAVVPYYERFLSQFPDVQTLARAAEDDVLRAWEGLGYYRRARQLHAAARKVVENHAGEFPRDLAALRSLPGVGRYVAGAVLSFAFNEPAPIVEANSQRVLARLLAWREDLRSSATGARLWKAAGRLVPDQGAGQFNQALMDLGAMVCTPRSPSCLICPLAARCGARQQGIQEAVPLVTPRPAPLAVAEACAVVVRDDSLLLVRRCDGGLWARFWEFPTINLAGADPAGRAFDDPVTLAEGVRRLTGIQIEPGPKLKTLIYAVTKHRVTLEAHLARALSGTLKPGPGLDQARWITHAELTSLALGSATRRLATWLNQEFDRLRKP